MPDNEQRRADISKSRGEVAAAIQDPDVRKKFIAKQGEGKMSDAELDAQTYRVRNQLAAGAAPTMHKGGVVKKDGLHNLQKGEVVIAKDKVKEMKNAKGLMAGMSEAAEEKSEPKDNKKEEKSEKKSSAKKHNIKHHIIHHHPNGSHTLTAVHNAMEDGKPGEEISAAVPDDAGMHAMLDQNLGGGEPAPAVAAGPAQS